MKYFLVNIFREKSLLADAFSGRILIDGVDIAQLGLGTLRSKLTIIPQVTTIQCRLCLRRSWPECIEWSKEGQACPLWYDLAPPPAPSPLPPVNKMSLFLCLPLWRRSSLLTGAGEEQSMLLIRKLFPVQCRIGLPDPYYFIKDSTKFKKKIQSWSSSLLLI